VFDEFEQSPSSVNIDVLDERVTLQVDYRIHDTFEYSLWTVQRKRWSGIRDGSPEELHTLFNSLLSSPMVSLRIGKIFLSLMYSDA